MTESPPTAPSPHLVSRYMSNESHAFTEGDRVRATNRDAFPNGTVIKILDLGFLLIRWDGDVLETAHHRDLTKIDS